MYERTWDPAKAEFKNFKISQGAQLFFATGMTTGKPFTPTAGSYEQI